MPNLPISGLPVVTVPNNSYTIAAVSASVTSQMSLSQVAAAISSSFTASQAISASYALSASYEINIETSSSYADTASFVTGSNVYGPFGSNSIISSSYAVSASYAPAQVSASYATTASYAVSASYAPSSVSSSYALTASYWDGGSAYVPYTGAITNVNLGGNDLTADNVIVSPPGYGLLAALSRDISGTGYGSLVLKNGATGYLIPTSSLTVDRTYLLPDKSGTVAMLSDITASGAAFPYTGSARITGSLDVTGSLNVSGSITAVNTIIANRASILDANYNTIVGGGSAISGYDNTALGLSALGNGSVGIYNVAVGDSAQAGVQSGSYNVSLGAFALEGFPIPLGASSGSYNTAIGTSAMQNLGQGSYNVALGLSALQGRAPNTGSASYNIAIGVSASFSASSAINNITIGYRAGANITTGSYNTIIGSFTGSSTLANNVVLADGQGQVRYQWNGSTNGFTGSISQTSVTSSLIKADANGQLVAAVGGTDYTPPAYLSAFHTASLTVPSPNTPNTMSFSTVDFAQGVTISGSWSDKIKVTNGGVYNLQFSAATTKTTGTSATVDIWLRKNESDLSYTNTIVTLAGGANDFAVPAWNFFVSASAGDYYQLMFASPTTNPYIAYASSGSSGVAVQVPSVILTVNRIA